MNRCVQIQSARKLFTEIWDYNVILKRGSVVHHLQNVFMIGGMKEEVMSLKDSTYFLWELGTHVRIKDF